MFTTSITVALLLLLGIAAFCTYSIFEPKTLRMTGSDDENPDTTPWEAPEPQTAIAAVSLPPPEETIEAADETAPTEPTKEEKELADIITEIERTDELPGIETLVARGRLQAAYRAANETPGTPASSARAEAWSIIVRKGVNVNQSRIIWAIHGLTKELRGCDDYDLLQSVYFLALDTAEFCGDRNVPCPRLRVALRLLYPKLSPLLQSEAIARLKSQAV